MTTTAHGPLPRWNPRGVIIGVLLLGLLAGAVYGIGALGRVTNAAVGSAAPDPFPPDPPVAPIVAGPASGTPAAEYRDETAGIEQRTVVSLTFDDGNANQQLAVDILDEHGLPGTFYVPSGYIDEPNYLTQQQLREMAQAGHEIGGHTVSHADLATRTPDEVKRQVCDDRVRLTELGHTVRSFAYPFGSSDAMVTDVVEECGYTSGRELGGLGMPGEAAQLTAEEFEPGDPYHLLAPDQVETSWSVDDMKQLVLRAEETGGWLMLTFHNVCEAGCPISVTPADFDELASWLKDRTDRGTVVRTVGETMGDAVRPLVAAPQPAPLVPGENGVRNGGFEQVGADDTPVCWQRGGFGRNTRELATTGDAHGGDRAARLEVTGYADGDAKWLTRFDLGECAPPVEPERTYSLRAWYAASEPAQFAVYLRSEAGDWVFWTASPFFDPTDEYRHAAWETPEVPQGATAIAFGLSVVGDGTLTVDDAELYDAEGAPEPVG